MAVAATLCGCGEGNRPAAAPAPVADAGRVQFETLAVLPPDTPTLLSGRGGVLWWSQRREGVPATVFRQGADGLPRRSGLDRAAVAAALGVRELDGEFAGLIADDGGVIFAFAGVGDGRTVTALGRFDTESGRVRLAATADRLAELTGMGPSLALAEAALVGGDTGGVAWLWLRTPDQSAALRFDPAALRDPAAAAVPLTRDLVDVRTERLDLDLTAADAVLTPGPGGTLVLTRAEVEGVWLLAPTGGGRWRGELILDLAELPRQTTPPASDGRGGAATWVPAAPPRRPDLTRTPTPPLTRQFPAVAVLRPDAEPVLWPADRMASPLNTTLAQLRPDVLRPAGEPGAMLTYDTATGDVLRITIPPAGAGGG